MSNEQKMVSVPRALAENAANYMEGSASAQVNIWCRDLRALLDAQHLVCSNGLLCQDRKCPECGGNGAHKPAAQHQGEPVALPERKHVPDFAKHPMLNKEYAGWNAYLGEIAKLGPLYKHADSGEVERLRDQLAAWQSLAAERLEMIGLRDDKLAEREALLREWLENVDEAKDWVEFGGRVKAALSAGGESEVKS